MMTMSGGRDELIIKYIFKLSFHFIYEATIKDHTIITCCCNLAALKSY